MASTEQPRTLPYDACGAPVQNYLGSYGPNKDAHPGTSWTIKFTNTASTITELTGTTAASDVIVLQTGECYRMTMCGAVITDKAFIQIAFGETAAPGTTEFGTIPASAGGTNAIRGLLWSACIDPNFDFKVLPGQKYLAVKVGPDAFASPATGGPWICLRKMS